MSDALHQNEMTSRFYNRQNKAIHQARAILGMELDQCREIARQIGGTASISALSIRQRWELIEELKSKGAKVYNPPLSQSGLSYQELTEGFAAEKTKPKPKVDPQLMYPIYLARWDKRFQKPRPGYASNGQLAWIQTLWELDFTDGKGDTAGLRKFVFRQTKSLPDGPVSDLAFLKDSHVDAIITPMKLKAKDRLSVHGGKKRSRKVN